MNRKIIVRISIAVLMVVGLMAALTIDARHASAATADSNQVVIDNFTFTPQTVTVHAGTQVAWINHDDIPHNIVSSDNKFRSKALDTNDQFSFTFSEPGTYEYFCGLHPRMTGKIIVQQ